MDNSILMRQLHGICQNSHHFGCTSRGLRRAAQLFREGSSREEFHYEEGSPVHVSHVMNLHDVRML